MNNTEQLYQQLVDNISIILPQIGMEATEKGAYYQALCPNPSHPGGDHRPSWTIRKDNGVFRCWSCGYTGNIYTLIKQMTGQNPYFFTGLSTNSKPSFGYRSIKKVIRTQPTKKPRYLQIKGEFYDPYTNSEVAAYLQDRGISKEYVNTFRVTYTPSAWINGTRFVNRLCTPIILNHSVVNLEGRDYTRQQEPKVLYPRNSNRDTLFNLDNLDWSLPLYVVEGLMDHAKVWMYLSRNSTCTFGASLTKHQIELLHSFDRVIVIPDNDEAGFNVIKQIDAQWVDKQIYLLPLSDRFKDPGECNSNGDFSLTEIVSYNEYVYLKNKEKLGILPMRESSYFK